MPVCWLGASVDYWAPKPPPGAMRGKARAVTKSQRIPPRAPSETRGGSTG